MLIVQTQESGKADASSTSVGVSVFPPNRAVKDDKRQEMGQK